MFDVLPVLLAGLCITAPVVSATTQTGTSTPLPTAPFINNAQIGNFTWPSGSTGSFDQGTTMDITWDSSYEQVNIYLICNQTIDENIGQQCQITTGLVDAVSYQWTVDCAVLPNCGTTVCPNNVTLAPFVLRIVDASGTTAELNGGGFWSREFYIQPVSSSSTTSTSSTSTSTSSTFPLTSSSLPTTSSSTASIALATSASSMAILAATSASSPIHRSNDSLAIGIGTGVGVGAALLLSGAVAFFIWRRRSRQDCSGFLQPPPPSYPESMWQQTATVMSQVPSKSPVHQVYTAHFAEAPGQYPHELPAR